MCNSIFLSDKTIPKAKEGEEVEMMVKGIYHTDEDGTRTFEVLEAEGEPILEPEEEEEVGTCGMKDDHEDMMMQNADDALRMFVIKIKKEK